MGSYSVCRFYISPAIKLWSGSTKETFIEKGPTLSLKSCSCPSEALVPISSMIIFKGLHMGSYSVCRFYISPAIKLWSGSTKETFIEKGPTLSLKSCSCPSEALVPISSMIIFKGLHMGSYSVCRFYISPAIKLWSGSTKETFIEKGPTLSLKSCSCPSEALVPISSMIIFKGLHMGSYSVCRFYISPAIKLWSGSTKETFIEKGPTLSLKSCSCPSEALVPISSMIIFKGLHMGSYSVCRFYISPAIKLWSGSTKETFIEKGPTLSLKSCSCPSEALVPISSMIIFKGLHMGSYSVCRFYISPAIKLWSGSTKETFIEKGPTLSLKSCSCPSEALVPISSMIIFKGLHMGSYSVCRFYISPAIKLWSGSTKETFIEKGPTLSLKSCSCPSEALVPISSMIIFKGLHMGSCSVCRLGFVFVA